MGEFTSEDGGGSTARTNNEGFGRFGSRLNAMVVYTSLTLSFIAIFLLPPVFAALAFAAAAADALLWDARRGAALAILSMACGFAGLVLGFLTAFGFL